MNKYRQTAADLEDQRDEIDQTYIERLLGIALAFFIGTGLAAALAHWWSC